MSNKFTARQKLISYIIAGIAVTALFFFFVIKRQMTALESLHNLTQKNKDEYNRLIAEETAYKIIQADLLKIGDRSEQIKSLFPIKEGLVANIKQLEAAASAYQDDFSMTITDPEETESSTPDQAAYTIVPDLKNIQVIPYDFNIKGSFLGVVKFLKTLENQPFYSEIESLSINSVLGSSDPNSPKKRRTGQIEAKIRAAFYADKKTP